VCPRTRRDDATRQHEHGANSHKLAQMAPRFVSVLVAVTCAGALCAEQKWRAAELAPPVAQEPTRQEPTRERPPWRRRASTKTEARSPVTEEAAAKTAEVRSPVTEEAAAKTKVRSPVTDEVAARPFNLADEVLSRKGCHRGGDPVGPRAVAPLAIARAGSDTVILTMKRWERGLSHPFPHDHYCTLEDYAARGARRVVVSLRDPVSRLISGYMRRMEGHSMRDSNGYNSRFDRAFSSSLESYVAALVDPHDKLHREALEVTYGDGGTQNYMMPVVEFYLSLPRAKKHDENSKERTYKTTVSKGELDLIFTTNTTTVAEVTKHTKLEGVVEVDDALVSIDGVPTTPKILFDLSQSRFGRVKLSRESTLVFEKPGSRDRSHVVEVAYACLERLDDDLEAIRDMWKIAPASAPPPPHEHKSTSVKPTLSNRSRAAIYEIYAKDTALHDRACTHRESSAPPVVDYFLANR